MAVRLASSIGLHQHISLHILQYANFPTNRAHCLLLRRARLKLIDGARVLPEPAEEDLLSDTGPNCVTFFSSHIRPLRAVTQQSHFSAALDLTIPHDTYILQACNDMQREFPSDILCKKIIIPPNLKPAILQQLYAMNVTPHSLFPGLDGFGRTLSDLATLKAVKSGLLISRQPSMCTQACTHCKD